MAAVDGQKKDLLTLCELCDDVEGQQTCMWYPKDVKGKCPHLVMVGDLCHCSRIMGWNENAAV